MYVKSIRRESLAKMKGTDILVAFWIPRASQIKLTRLRQRRCRGKTSRLALMSNCIFISPIRFGGSNFLLTSKYMCVSRIINFQDSKSVYSNTGYLTTERAFYMPWYAKGVHFTYFFRI